MNFIYAWQKHTRYETDTIVYQKSQSLHPGAAMAALEFRFFRSLGYSLRVLHRSIAWFGFKQYVWPSKPIFLSYPRLCRHILWYQRRRKKENFIKSYFLKGVTMITLRYLDPWCREFRGWISATTILLWGLKLVHLDSVSPFDNAIQTNHYRANVSTSESWLNTQWQIKDDPWRSCKSKTMSIVSRSDYCSETDGHRILDNHPQLIHLNTHKLLYRTKCMWFYRKFKIIHCRNPLFS